MLNARDSSVELSLNPTPYNPFIIQKKRWEGLKIIQLESDIHQLDKWTRQHTKGEWAKCALITTLGLGLAAGSIPLGIYFNVWYGMGTPLFTILTPAYAAYFRTSPSSQQEKQEAAAAIKQYHKITDRQIDVPKELFLRLHPYLRSRPNFQTLSFNQLRWLYEDLPLEERETALKNYREIEPQRAVAFQAWLGLDTACASDLHSSLLSPHLDRALKDGDYLQAFLLKLTKEQLESDPIIDLLIQKLPIHWKEYHDILHPAERREALRGYIETLQESKSSEMAEERMETILRKVQRPTDATLTLTVKECHWTVSQKSFIQGSPLLKELLKEGNTQIDLPDRDPKHIDILVEFLNKRSLSFAKYKAQDFLATAQEFRVEALRTFTEAHLIRTAKEIYGESYFTMLFFQTGPTARGSALLESLALALKYDLKKYLRELLIQIDLGCSYLPQDHSHASQSIEGVFHRCQLLADATKVDLKSLLLPILIPALAKTIPLKDLPRVWSESKHSPDTPGYLACAYLEMAHSIDVAHAFGGYPPFELKQAPLDPRQRLCQIRL